MWSVARCGLVRLPVAPEPTARCRYDQGHTRVTKTAVSIPDELFESAEGLARRLGMTRNELYAEALRDYLREHRGRGSWSVSTRFTAGRA
ncbi:MAG: hypothetical protein AVDCRST_MAG78-3485 [uncultured Rubrobacteraceae bacterium]|uniref:Ribbon-helix-helix protein CopG domain-containing protein n=1 Tax=uncultured Rubrobacteraceae bacterium TaxID=349277 RepID=A0A6J4QYN2_9ACTN|nr:MAG: hypothetical protein AVDCRST_MAG78-3485 [uncultured Rubrobacteraceae bacterium]